MRKKNFFLSVNLCLLLIGLIAAPIVGLKAQSVITQSVELSWQPELVNIPINENGNVQVLSFKGASFDLPRHSFPIFTQKVALSTDGQLTAKIRNLQYEVLTLPDIMATQANNFIRNTPTVHAKITYNRKKPYAFVEFVPIRRNAQTGQYEKLVRFDMEYSVQSLPTTALQKGSRSYAEQSVLAQGTWYKLKVQETGIYKIDRQFLQNLGVSGTINIQQVRIYGNGGGMLPELAGMPKYDDLIENPVNVTDQNNNGIFDDNDYLTFYGEGPNVWQYNSTTKVFEYQINFYTSHNFYFITTDSGESKKIQTRPTATYTPTVMVNAFDDFAVHEAELINPNNSGRKFYGEDFSLSTSQEFNFSFPNIRPDYKARITASFMARSIGASSSFTLFANDQSFFSQSLNSVSGSYEGDYGTAAVRSDSIGLSSPNLTLRVQYNKPNSGASGWLDYLAINVQRRLLFGGGQMKFRHAASVGTGQVAEFVWDGLTANSEVWDITHANTVERVPFNSQLVNGGVGASFTALADELREYIVFDGSSYLTPDAVGQVANQNLHAREFPNYIIVSYPDFLQQAEQLADFHRQNDNLTVKVVTTEQVFNEFASGAPDVSAIRDYVKMYYDLAGLDEDLMPKYLLLFGDASYDYKNVEVRENENTNFVPVYEYIQSLDTNSSFCTDDYVGSLDDVDGDNINSRGTLIDVAVGRLPVKTAEEAQSVAEKIQRYAATSSFGDWRNRVTVIGDDEDGNTHLLSAEKYANYIAAHYPQLNIDKIYLDAYQQIATAGGNSYPDVNKAIDRAIFNGAVLVDYAGHGGERAWAHETILSLPQLQAWNNIDKLPVFITATCSFGRYDNPGLTSGGEEIVLKGDGGAIAAFTTNRLVYAAFNERLNLAVLEHMFKRDDNNGMGLPLGEIMRLGKNEADTASSSQAENNRKFALLGDPALRLSLPRYQVTTSTINAKPLAQADTLKAMAQITITGEVRDLSGNVLNDFNGLVYPTVYDKMITLTTRGNDPPSDGVAGSTPRDFTVRKNVIFKGKATVNNGQFSFTFIVPRDIMYQVGSGRISYYAQNTADDAQGYTEQVTVGGVSNNASNDTEGPKVDVYMNDENFVFGGSTHENPILFVKLYDNSGINTVGNSIGHNLMAVLDNDDNLSYNLNSYYETETDNYQRGSLRYPLSGLSVGPHNVSVKAWDVFNNSGTSYTEFIVAESAELALSHVLNYPNPFTDFTDFWFEHNQAGQTLDITVQVMALSGRIVKTINRQINSDGFRVNNITWDGLDDFGNKIGRGTYVYTLTVRTSDGKTARKVEKLVILK